MRVVLLSTYDSRGGVELLLGLAVRLWGLNARDYDAVFGPALNTHRVANGLPPVGNVRDYLLGEHPWLATDPVLAPWPEPADLGVVQTGAWILPDERPLPADLEAFLDAGPPPVYTVAATLLLREAASRTMASRS